MMYINGQGVAPVLQPVIDNSHDYSTDEQVIGTWIDGSTLYEKTITDTLTTAVEKTITVSTESIKVVEMNGCFALSSNDYERLPLYYSDICRVYQSSATTVKAYARANYTNLTCTIRYIKE